MMFIQSTVICVQKFTLFQLMHMLSLNFDVIKKEKKGFTYNSLVIALGSRDITSIKGQILRGIL